MAVGGRSDFSAHTLAVLAELCATPSRWQHGYGIAGDAGLKSGTLYPVLHAVAMTAPTQAPPVGQVYVGFRIRGGRPVAARAAP